MLLTARHWLCGAVTLALLLPFADLAASCVNEAGPPADRDLERGAASGRSIVVLSDNVSITLAQGAFDTGLQPFPDLETGRTSMRADVPQNLVGQLVDGNYTLLSHGGGREAAARNHGVAGHGEVVRWWFAGVEQSPLPVAYRSPGAASPAADDINGTFYIRNWLPDPALVPIAGLYEMRFCFCGTRVLYPGYGEFQVFPPSELRFDVTVLFPTQTSILGPAISVNAGSTAAIQGEVSSSDGGRPAGGMVVTTGGRTLGPPLPAGIFLDDVLVCLPGIPATVYREGFESPDDVWSTGGEGGDWEAGTPPAIPSPYKGQRCIGTGICGSYSHMADEWAETPAIDLSPYGPLAEFLLSFAFWTDLNTGDQAALRVWNGTEWSDDVPLRGHTAGWEQFDVELGKLTSRGRPMAVAGTSDLRVRFFLRSSTPSAAVVDGAFSLDWELPDTAGPGAQFLTFRYVPDGPYASSHAYLKVEVAGKLGFFVPEGSPRLGPDRWAVVWARLLDAQGRPPALPLSREGGSGPLRVFWQRAGAGPIMVESVTAVNRTGWFAAAHHLAQNESPEGASFVLHLEGTSAYQPAELSVNCTFRWQARLELSPPGHVLRGGTSAVDGRLLVDERPMAKKAVDLSLPFAPFALEATTDAAGGFSACFTVPAGWPGETVRLEARAGAGWAERPACATAEVPVTRLLVVAFEGQRLEKGAPARTVLGGESFNGLAGRVTDEMGRPVAGAEVLIEAIRAGGMELVGRTSSGTDGYFSLPYTPDWSERAGALALRALAGHEPSPPAGKEAVFQLWAGTVLLLDEPPRLVPGAWAIVTGTLREDQNGRPGEPVRDALVRIDFGGRGYSALTDPSGRFRASCAVARSEGDLTVGAFYDGEPSMAPSSDALTTAVEVALPASQYVPGAIGRPVPYSGAMAAGSVFLAVLGAALIGGLEAGRAKLLLALAPLYSKIQKEEVLDQFVRGQVFGYIQANPGDHYSSIRETLRLKNGTLAYHLRTLERESFVFSRMDGIYRRFYPTGADPARLRTKGALKETHQRMLELVESRPGITPKEMAKSLGTSHQVASYHIRILARRGRIRIEQKGRNTLCYPAGPLRNNL